VACLAGESGLEVEASLAGVTSDPLEYACEVRRGGFGGTSGLVDHLAASGIDLLLDATHPFSAQMPHQAARAARVAGIGRLRLCRPSWTADGSWHLVRDAAGAASWLADRGPTRALLTLGRQHLADFVDIADLTALVRSIEPPEGLGSTELVSLIGRGPWTVEQELDLLDNEGVEVLVTRNSGGDDAKLVAAGILGVEVVMIERPEPVPGPMVDTVQAALDWIRARRASRSTSGPGLANISSPRVAAGLPSEPPVGAHGGDAGALADWLGIDVAGVLDLSASLNPVAPEVTSVLGAHLDEVGRYPDATKATVSLADAIGVDPERVVLTNGGAEAIALLAAMEPIGDLEDPTFSLYARHLDRVTEGAPRWRPNPSSPLGRLAEIDDHCEVWDEAFWPMCTGTWTRGDEDAWRLGSLTKLWACPGLRLGYVIAPDVGAARRLGERQPRWSVNGLAAAVVGPLLAETDLGSIALGIATRKASLVHELRGLGLDVTDTEACWVLVRRAGLRRELAPTGILVRDCASFGLDDTFRIAVPGHAELDRLIHALELLDHAPAAADRASLRPPPEP